MDRQSLLEQKRQRLQELKQRRQNTTTDVESLIDRLQNTPKRGVNIAIQTEDNDETINLQAVPNLAFKCENNDIQTGGKTVVTFDKGIQTIDDFFFEEQPDKTKLLEPKSDHKEDEIETMEDQDHNSLEINKEKELKYMLIKENIIIQERSEPKFDNESPPFINSKIYETIARRPVSCIYAKDGTESLIAVSYAPQKVSSLPVANTLENGLSYGSIDTIRSSPGFVVIYKNGEAERFLLAASPVTSILIDKNTSDRVMGGLKNGKIVVWELQHNLEEFVLLPSLISPILSSRSSYITQTNAPKLNFINHIYPVTCLLQTNRQPVVSISLDGVVNLWSTSLLATPRANSVQLFASNPSKEEISPLKSQSIATRKLSVTSIIQTESSNIAKQFSNVNTKNSLGLGKSRSINNSLSSYRSLTSSTEVNNDLSYLNQIIVGAQDGKIYKLCNDPEKDYIDKVAENDENSVITSMIEFPSYSLILTTGIEFGFKLWILTSQEFKKLITIQTNHLIIKAVARPGAKLQFVTIGFNKHTEENKYPIVEFWSLKEKLMNCVLKLETEVESLPMSVQFSQSGQILYVGLSNGQVWQWDIDESVLNKYIEEHTNEVDKGIQSII